MAVDTSNCRLGCLVFCAPYRNVGLLAKSATTVDHLSGGRFEIGLGGGWYEAEAQAFGLHYPSLTERFEILEEQLGALHAWRSGQRLTATGGHLALDDASMLPAPLGGLPLWVGGVGRTKTLRLAGAFADGWNAAYIGADEFRELNGVLDDWCAVAGREPADVERSINLMFNVSDDPPDVALAKLRDQWGDAADRVRQGALVGRPDDVMDQVASYVDAGAGLVNIVLRPPWDQDLLAAYVERIVPAMRAEWS
jgi:alkanesulfonate monooxygenase SsuD/methylene tetrahydromethanopterin reductase-like flavin-dependent oxidoreductase (luciferase family)